MLKRTFDIVMSLIGLLLVGPLLLVLAVCIKLGSKGPVFYRGVRVGWHGKRFRILKFRSMVVDAEQVGGTTTGQDDPRITRIGHFLRKHKLDELPQLLNVLVGDMSFVGPRPEVPEYADNYTEAEQVILSVRPGITDLSSLEFIDLQAHVGSEDPDKAFREKVLPVKNALRVKYATERTFAGDMAILARTFAKLFSGMFRRRR